MKNVRRNNGITIVSLVVTIIVLIILAGVSINALIGENGIITIAKNARENMELAVNEEQDRLAQLTNTLNSNTGGSSSGSGSGSESGDSGNSGNTGSSGGNNSESEDTPTVPTGTKQGTIVDLPSKWEQRSDVAYVSTESGDIVRSETKVASVYAVSVGNGDVVPVPNGFYYVGGTIESGVVISDNEADKNKYLFEDNNVKIENVPAGVAYNSDGTVNEANSILKGNQFVWIPCSIENYTKASFGKTNASGWDTSTNTAEEAQIRKYGGFYIGRYEAGTSNITLTGGVKFENASTASSWQNGNFVSSKVESGKITCKAGEIPYYHADYTTAVDMCKNMYITDSVTSGLMTGTMWDVVMKYITTDDASYSDLKSTAWGNYSTDTGVQYAAGQGRYITVNSSSGATSNALVADSVYHYGIRTTASSEGVKRNNIYDLAGNLREWTQEVAYKDSTTNLFMLRGGSFRYSCSDRPVCYRGYDTATNTYTYNGFRPALYIR